MGAIKSNEPSLFGKASYKGRPLKRREPVAEPTWRPIPLDTVLFCLDPSIAKCGWAIVRNTRPNPIRLDSGTFQPVSRPDINRHDHLAVLINQRLQLAREAEIVITDALLEVPNGGQWSTSTTQLMAYARSIGVCEATCYAAGLTMHRASVQDWKGMTKKDSTLRTVIDSFQYEPRDNNESDALGLGLWLCFKTPRAEALRPENPVT